uniref:Uncharacterized protein n=1 Tax=Candidozyma auris TaxID=498019 RepID=A0A0L0NQK6_CANAR
MQQEVQVVVQLGMISMIIMRHMAVMRMAPMKLFGVINWRDLSHGRRHRRLRP